jgi:hypothetical protein
MKALLIERTDETPEVRLDPEAGIFEFVGNSYPENSTKFYTPVLTWLRDFLNAQLVMPMTVDFNFDYFNTSSAKYILEILRLVQEHNENGNEVLVRWHYFEDDTDMQEAGEDYQATIGIPFELIMRSDTF